MSMRIRKKVLAAYKNQVLVWQTCPQNVRDYFGEKVVELDKLGGRARFALMRVPLDYDNPARGDLQIALLIVSAEDPARRLGAILFNPGGPGADGLNLSVILGSLWTNADTADPVKSLYKEMSRRYDLIGFSPRGTGFSTNLSCPSDEMFRFEAAIAVDLSRENIDNILYNSRLIAENCRKNPQTPYMNSETTVRDMDLVRHLLKDSKLNYMGFSYGTWLGTWYAGRYPYRVGRMMLIGTANITVPLNDVLLQQGMGQQRALDQVLVPYAARHNDRFSLGGTEEEVRQSYLSLKTMPGDLLAATSKLLPISKSQKADSTLLYLRAAERMQAFLAAHPEADQTAVEAWINTAQFVPDATLNQQARAGALEIAGLYFSRVRHETKPAALNGEDALQWAVMCNDSGSRFGVDAWIDENKKSVASYPFYGGFWVQNACLYWDAPTARRPAAAQVAGAGPILMLQSELDPWTTLEGAEATFARLPNTHMILIQNEYSHSLVPPYGQECVDRPVAEYFLYGTLPAKRLTRCAGNPLPADAAGNRDDGRDGDRRYHR
ncbi:MAG: alpha/beta hydrolase [Deltaproteobacteria bacterium]